MSDKPPKVDRRTAHYQKLQDAYYSALTEVHCNQGKKFEAYKVKLADNNCPHPDTYTFPQDSDDGYGRWWRNSITQCRVCGRVIKREPIPR